jgi:hypothetical protein
MKLIHDTGYTKEDRDSFKEIIFSNTIQSMRVIIEAMEKLEIPLANPSHKVRLVNKFCKIWTRSANFKYVPLTDSLSLSLSLSF